MLINGQRPPRSAASKGAYFDVSTLPLGMIDSVELLLDGSSVFGPDGTGGTVNLILRLPEPGASTYVRTEALTDGGGLRTSWGQRVGQDWDGVLRAGIAYEGERRGAIDARSRQATREIVNSGFTQADISPQLHQNFFLANAQWKIRSGTHLRVDASYVTKSMLGRYSSEIADLGPLHAAQSADTQQWWAVTALSFEMPRNWSGRIDAGGGASTVSSVLNQTTSSGGVIFSSRGHSGYNNRYARAHFKGDLFSIFGRTPEATLDVGTRGDAYRVTEPTATEGSAHASMYSQGSRCP